MVNTQAIWDARLLRDSGTIDSYVYVWYPPTSITGNAYNLSAANAPYEAHKTSVNRHLVKRTVYFGDPWLSADGNPNSFTGGLETTFAAWLANEIRVAGDDWLTIRGRPVVYFFSIGDFQSGLANTAFNAIKAAVPGVYIIALGGGTSAAILNAMAPDGYTPYGLSGAGLVGNGQHPYTDQTIRDKASEGWIPTGGRKYSPGITTAPDQRARQGTLTGSGIAWADPPTMPQLMRVVRDAYALGPDSITAYAGTEIFEGGPGNIVGNTFTGTYILDAIRYGKAIGTSLPRPTTYTYNLDAHNSTFAQTGTWTWTRSSALTIDNAGLNDEIRSTVAASTLTWAHEANTRMVLYCGKDPSYGHFSITVDGGSATVVDLAGTAASAVQCFDSGVLSEATHTYVITVQGDLGGVAIDYAAHTINPSSIN